METACTKTSRRELHPFATESNRVSLIGQVQVLVVDDDPLTRIAFRAVLENAGYEVQVAFDGLDALNHVGSNCQTQRPDIILLDQIMPRLNGIEFLETLVELKLAEKPAVIVLSGNWTKEFAARATELGACAVLAKPLSPDHLLEVIRHSIKVSRSAVESHSSV